MRKARILFLYTAIALVGGLMIGLAYLLVWRLMFLGKLIQYAGATVLAFLGCSLISICFSFLPLLWNQDEKY